MLYFLVHIFLCHFDLLYIIYYILHFRDNFVFIFPHMQCFVYV